MFTKCVSSKQFKRDICSFPCKFEVKQSNSNFVLISVILALVEALPLVLVLPLLLISIPIAFSTRLFKVDVAELSWIIRPNALILCIITSEPLHCTLPCTLPCFLNSLLTRSTQSGTVESSSSSIISPCTRVGVVFFLLKPSSE